MTNLWYTTHAIHGTIVYLPTFTYIDTITINQMLVNIPVPWMLWYTTHNAIFFAAEKKGIIVSMKYWLLNDGILVIHGL